MRMFDLSTGIWTQHAVSRLIYMLHECGVWRLPIYRMQYSAICQLNKHQRSSKHICISGKSAAIQSNIEDTRSIASLISIAIHTESFFIDVLNMMDEWFDWLLTVRFVFLGFLFLFRFPFLVLHHLNRICFLCCILNRLTLASIMWSDNWRRINRQND